ncbi:MAG: Oligopeptide transport ATP-binding protein OppF [Myxococcota bacterium]|nr:Oligopeptide transport ATP-binding protein OppF [Myxococcota bacterium]
MAGPLLEIRNLTKHFPIKGGVFARTVGLVKAVDGVSLTIHEGETVGLVGESGCGKSTLGRAILKLIQPTSGSILFQGQDITAWDAARMRPMRRNMQIIFQDPASSLNPRMTVGDLIGEAFVIQGMAPDRAEREAKIQELLSRVGLRPEHINRYPHEFSGGQRQRIGIARSLAVHPGFIVCDEPISALDVSIQGQILNLLMDLQRDLGLTYLFIAHDLKAVEHMSDRVAVMYLGKVVELAGSDDLYREPAHPYSRALLSAVPNPDPAQRKERIVLKGDVPSPINPPSGCAFHPRCPMAQERCSRETPELREVKPGHHAACHFAG